MKSPKMEEGLPDIELARKQIKDDIIFERTQPTKQRSTFYKNSNKFNVNVNPTSPVSDPPCPENPVKCDAFKSPSTKPKTLKK
ncbi:hypothetical protein Avbf_16570 [Armadillidium vulgare]|nr:hypothetical protein Avbf_16570 [Armadillidium vulgare]